MSFSSNNSGNDSGYETPEENIIKKVDKTPSAPKKGSRQCWAKDGWKFYNDNMKNIDVGIKKNSNGNCSKKNCGK